MKYAFSVEIVPVCKDDLVCLPGKLASAMGGLSPLLLCLKISNQISLMDPFTLRSADVPTANYWTNPFSPVLSSRKLIEYTILDISPLGPVNGKYVLADVEVARTSDLGRNNQTFLSRTHLGHLLNAGDCAWGTENLPEVVLVRKGYPERRKKNRQRHWQLKVIEKTSEEPDPKKGQGLKTAEDYEMFVRDLEEDPEMRSMVNLYKRPDTEQLYSQLKREEEEEMGGEDFPEVQLEELMEDLSIQ